MTNWCQTSPARSLLLCDYSTRIAFNWHHNSNPVDMLLYVVHFNVQLWNYMYSYEILKPFTLSYKQWMKLKLILFSLFQSHFDCLKIDESIFSSNYVISGEMKISTFNFVWGYEDGTIIDVIIRMMFSSFFPINYGMRTGKNNRRNH
jgi:hypothetical protein